MTTNRFLLWLFFWTLSMSTMAQSYKKKSIVFFNNGDSTTGWIRYTGWSHNPQKFEFYRDSTLKNGQILSLDDVRSFQIYGYKAYQRAVLPHKDETGLETLDTVFLQVLVKGEKASLYGYKDDNWIYYLQDSTDNYLPLQESDEMGKEVFRDQLKKCATQLARYELFEQIAAAEYSVESLSDIVEKLNGENGGVAYSAEKTNKHHLAAFAGPGIGMTKLAVSGTEDFLENIRFPYRVIPSFSGGVDLTGSEDFEKSVFRLMVSFSSNYYNGSGPATTSDADQVSYLIKQTNIDPELGFLYHFNRIETWRFYLGASVGYNLSFYRENQMNQTLPEGTYRNYLEMESGWLDAHVYLGLLVNEHFECALSGLVLGDFTEANQFNLSPRTYTFSVLYHFVNPKRK